MSVARAWMFSFILLGSMPAFAISIGTRFVPIRFTRLSPCTILNPNEGRSGSIFAFSFWKACSSIFTIMLSQSLSFAISTAQSLISTPWSVFFIICFFLWKIVLDLISFIHAVLEYFSNHSLWYNKVFSTSSITCIIHTKNAHEPHAGSTTFTSSRCLNIEAIWILLKLPYSCCSLPHFSG